MELKFVPISVLNLFLQKQKKYTDEQVDLAISLREQGVILLEITKQTGIKYLYKDFQRIMLNCQKKTKK